MSASTAPASAPPAIALLRQQSLAAAVQQEIERSILDGDYPPGSKLNEAALALRFGVSRGPVREAFRVLDEAGLVRTEKNRGVFVRDIPVDEAVEIFELRAAMEEAVGRRLADGMTAAQRAEAEQLVQDMEQAVRNQDAHRYHGLNLAFHDRLVEMAGNRKLAAIYRKLVKEIALFRRLHLADEGRLPASAQAHWEILRAIASGQPELAGRVLYEHAIEGRNRLLAGAAHRSGPAQPPPPPNPD